MSLLRLQVSLWIKEADNSSSSRGGGAAESKLETKRPWLTAAADGGGDGGCEAAEPVPLQPEEKLRALVEFGDLILANGRVYHRVSLGSFASED